MRCMEINKENIFSLIHECKYDWLSKILKTNASLCGLKLPHIFNEKLTMGRKFEMLMNLLLISIF